VGREGGSGRDGRRRRPRGPRGSGGRRADRVHRRAQEQGHAKDLVDGAPKEVKANIPKTEAEDIAKKLKDAGAEVEIK
jgi:hypothetical protein